jgi:hypothetical protein
MATSTEEVIRDHLDRFRTSMEWTLNQTLREIGVLEGGEVFLVRYPKGQAAPSVSAPGDLDWIDPSALIKVPDAAKSLLAADPDRELRHSHPVAHAALKARLRDRSWRKALVQVLAELRPGSPFFPGPGVPLGDATVYAVVELPAEVMQRIRRIPRTDRPGRASLPVSFLDSVIEHVLLLGARGFRASPLLGPDEALNAYPHEIAQRAAETFCEAIAERAGQIMPSRLFSDLAAVSVMRLEKEAGIGRILLARIGSEDVVTRIALAKPVHLRERRALRKLLALAQGSPLQLLTDGRTALGLGRLSDDYDATTERAYSLEILGEGRWQVTDSTGPLLDVSFGRPSLPAERLSRETFDDTAGRIFVANSDLDRDRLWEAIRAAQDSDHGALLVVSQDADKEAARLAGQALLIAPVVPTPDVLDGLVRIDGAVLLAPDGTCHAAGAILDGKAMAGGDPSRGARYNSALRYVEGAESPTLAVVVSEDGMVDLVPSLPRRHSVRHIASAVDAVVEAAEAPVIDYERFHREWERLERLEFYLSQEQCERANVAHQAVEDRRWKDSKMRLGFRPLAPDPRMSQEFLWPR